MAATDGLVVGYATPSEHVYGAALEALCAVLPPGADCRVLPAADPPGTAPG